MKVKFRTRYDRVCSIGHYCATAMYMRRHFLRSASGPLDWMAGSPRGLALNVSLVCGGFEGFLRKDRLRPMENLKTESDDLDHDYYMDEGTGMASYHDFPAGVPLEQSYAKVREKYDRRIARFYATVPTGRTLLVFHTKCEPPTEAETVAAAEKLRGRLGSGVDLLVIENVDSVAEAQFTEPAPGVYLARGRFHRPEKDRVLGDRELCDRVYGAIRCKGRLSRRLRAWYLKTLAKAASAFVIGGERRRAVRARLSGRGGGVFN
ncbi:MAG: hypothetical protein J6T01_06250 [Kiritimatiellae bacterium]|nr:hypothetical protein [Kiritimatiellia bacterium]